METRTGWVFRTDAAPVPAEPPPPETVWVPVRTAPPRVEQRSTAPAARRSRGWIESGLYVMALPVALPVVMTVGMMLAPMVPVIWMLGARTRR